jgi:hypothetical protein
MRLHVSVAVVGLFLLSSLPGGAQPRDGFPQMPGDMTPAEVQQLFDAFELVRAEEMLELTTEQYPEFVARLQALQEGRRDAQRGRQTLLRELQRLVGQRDTDESVFEDRLEALTTHDRETMEKNVSALKDIDAILDARQRVRFRLFQQAMERRRLELFMRARRPQARPGRDRF